jgi:cytochrome c-type biogenesis protein CcmF
MENMTLIHNVPTPMGKYVVSYLGDSSDEKNEKVYFKLHFSQTDSSTGRVKDEFFVYPDAFLMKGEKGTQLSSNPGARHYLTRDIFVYITSWLNPDNIGDTATFRIHPVREGDTVFYSNGFLVVERILAANKYDNKDLPVVDSAWLSEATVYAKDGRRFKVQPAFFIKDNQPSVKTDTVVAQSLVLSLQKNGNGDISLGIKESDAVLRYITLKAYKFPYINLLWLGTLIMVTGFFLSAYYRIKKNLRVAA